jgi:hypothetical protein
MGVGRRAPQFLLSIALALASAVVIPEQSIGAETSHQSNTTPLKIQFVASEPCALVMFVNILAERHHTTTWVKGWYEKKCKATPGQTNNLQTDKPHLNAYRKLIDREEKHFTYVDEVGRNRSIDEVIMCEAARSNYIPELLTRLKGKLSPEDISSLQDVIYYFEPIYQELIWQPRSANFKKQVEEFRQQTIATKMCERLTQVKQFLNSPWKSDVPFIVALSPLPMNGKSSSGQSMGIVQTVELKPSEKFRDAADVVFHEAVHALWFAKKDADETMKLFSIPGKGSLPITELYEGMATALGQGWYSKLAFERTQKNWYSDSIINHYAQVVEPLYADYLKQGRKLDAAFAKEATAVYYRMYPHVESQINLTSCYLVLADEMEDFAGFRKQLYTAMPRLRECSINTPINAKEGFAEFSQSHAERAAILTSVSKVEQLKGLGLPQSEVEKLKRIPSGFTTITFGGRKVLFCLAETSNEQKKIFLDVLKQRNWPGL